MVKYGIYEQKMDGKMIFTDYWKVLVLIFLEMVNTVSFSAKKLMERWYLLIIEKFLFWIFRWWEMQSFFWVKKLMERWYLLVNKKFLFGTFWWWEIRPFFSQKVDKNIIFTWSFGTWEIRFFVQSISQTFSSFLIQSLAWYVLFQQVLGR